MPSVVRRLALTIWVLAAAILAVERPPLRPHFVPNSVYYPAVAIVLIGSVPFLLKFFRAFWRARADGRRYARQRAERLRLEVDRGRGGDRTRTPDEHVT